MAADNFFSKSTIYMRIMLRFSYGFFCRIKKNKKANVLETCCCICSKIHSITLLEDFVVDCGENLQQIPALSTTETDMLQISIPTPQVMFHAENVYSTRMRFAKISSTCIAKISSTCLVLYSAADFKKEKSVGKICSNSEQCKLIPRVCAHNVLCAHFARVSRT